MNPACCHTFFSERDHSPLPFPIQHKNSFYKKSTPDI
jgi:hypothetical protein